MNAAQARELAIAAVAATENAPIGEGQPVVDTTVVGRSFSGYWVADNGEEVSGLSKEQAVEIIVENLTANDG